MKTILVPTDYSEAADNALYYAMELAKIRSAKVILFHAYGIPLPEKDVAGVIISPAGLEKENGIRIKNLEKDIAKRFCGKIKVEHIVRAGFVSEEILSVVKEKNIDVIVMGIAGAGGNKLDHALIGSNTISIIKKTKIPVLVIPQNCTFKKIEKIVFACDYQQVVNKDVLDKLKTFVRLFKTKLIVLDVMKPESIDEKSVAESTLGNSLTESEIDYSLYCPMGTDVTYEINYFVDKHKPDWLTMAPQSYKLFEGLFHTSNTKQMAFHTHIPLLSIHN